MAQHVSKRVFELTAAARRRSLRDAAVFALATAYLVVSIRQDFQLRGVLDQAQILFAVVCFVLAVGFFLYPRRAHLSVAGDSVIYCDGILARTTIPFDAIRTAYVSERTHMLVLRCNHGRRVKLRFRFEDFDGFVVLLRAAGVSVVDYDSVEDNQRTKRRQHKNKSSDELA